MSTVFDVPPRYVHDPKKFISHMSDYDETRVNVHKLVAGTSNTVVPFGCTAGSDDTLYQSWLGDVSVIDLRWK